MSDSPGSSSTDDAKDFTLDVVSTLRKTLLRLSDKHLKTNKDRAAIISSHVAGLLYVLLTTSLYEVKLDKKHEDVEPDHLLNNPEATRDVVYLVLNKALYILNNTDTKHSYTVRIEEHEKEAGIDE